MKSTYLFYSIVAVAALTSCGGGAENKAEESAATNVAAETKMEKATWTVDPAESRIRWEGGTAGAMVYSHHGYINVKNGTLTTEGNQVTGGSIVVDMTTISPEGTEYTPENPKEKLVGHLSTGDFFLVEEFPVSSFQVKSVEGSTMKGDLTIRDKTNEETVDITSVEMSPDGKMMKATGTLTFDRQKYDVKWEHFMKDVVLSDDIQLQITLVSHKG